MTAGSLAGRGGGGLLLRKTHTLWGWAQSYHLAQTSEPSEVLLPLSQPQEDTLIAMLAVI